MINKLQVLIQDSFNPYHNLAVEKYLFDNVQSDSIILYLWQNKNTVVVGANQNPWAESNCTQLEADGGYVARRLSGGGTVFHDLGNVNFTFICADENYNVKNNLEIIKNACLLSDINAEVNGRNDILVDGKKFSGNAFYNSKGKSYHHGTILVNADFSKLQKYLTPSKIKLEAKGVKSVKSRVINLCEINNKINCDIVKQNLVRAFKDFYKKDVEYISCIDNEQIEILEKEYSSWDYIFKKTAPFTVTLQGKFEWGEITLHLNVIKGVVDCATVYTDSLDFTLALAIEKNLVGCNYNKKSVFDSLCNVSIDIATDISKLIN